MKTIQERLTTSLLVIDGAMGTEIQKVSLSNDVWEGKEGCNELLCATSPQTIRKIHNAYAMAGADIIKTNSFGSLPWVLDEYQIGDRTYELAKAAAQLVHDVCQEHTTNEKPRYAAGALGPGTKLPSLGHITFDEMVEGYTLAAQGLIDGGVDLFLLETCQDPLQIKAALIGCTQANHDRQKSLPIMVSVTMELAGTMLIGTDTTTIATILEPFDILSLGFNCGTGPVEVSRHVKTLSEIWPRAISVHANAGLPENRGGYTYYPMGPTEFATLQTAFAQIDGVAILGGCCGTTPQHIKALSDAVAKLSPKPPRGTQPNAIASLFETRALMQEPAPFLIGERSNATGSKAFRELLLAEDYEGTLSVGQQQVRSGAHGIDLSVAFAGRDESHDMDILSARYAQKISLPLMPDSTQTKALEIALKHIGGKPIINSVNLEDGLEKFDAVCALAKKYGASLVCLTIDEEGMAKTQEKKVAIAERIYHLATTRHGLRGCDLVFDMLTFTVGSGDEEYWTAAIETIEAIREFRTRHPETGAVLGVSNISFGLDKHAREYLNSVFLHHCVQAGLTMAIVNVKNTLPIHKISDEDRKVCEDLLFNRREGGDPLFGFIAHFADAVATNQDQRDEAYEKMSTREKIAHLLIEGDKERMLPLLEVARHEIAPEEIVNDVLINAMKVVGELFGSGKMQLPFVLQSAEVMKASVDLLNPYLPKTDKQTQTLMVLGTVKGDVHDVGKNLVDIILTNNGYKVVNLGIKVDVETFIAALKEHKAQAVGMSGLLVKSTLVMKEALEEMARQGITIPVMLGGAALTHRFIDEFCRPVYQGPIFYCRDAFDGITAMSRIEAGDMNTDLGGKASADHDMLQDDQPKVPLTIDPADVEMPSRAAVMTPPFWGRKVLDGIDPALAFEWINHRILFKQRWGFKSKGLTPEAYERQIKEVIEPAYERLKRQFLDENLFEPTIIYGYFPCRTDDNALHILDTEDRTRILHTMSFPRQYKKPHRALSDYFASEGDNCIALSIVSAGSKLSVYEKELFEQGSYQEYYLVHGLGVELAEALAEIVHKQIRIEWGIAKGEGTSLHDVQMRSYQGARYSFGYPSCPDLELNIPLFDLLKPEEFGITLSETYQIHPEQSTSAIITSHPEAMYYTL